MLTFLSIGALLGLSAGVAPGPLLTLVISETLRHGVRSGIKVALAPLITDLPIIAITLVILARLSGFQSLLGGISIGGGIFLFSMGWESLRTRGMALQPEVSAPRSLTKGIVANALNPQPYLFWLSVGAPTVTRAMNHHLLAAVGFVAGFYVLLVGSKVVLAVAVGKSRGFLSGKVYLNVMRLLGLALWVLAVVLVRDGLKLLGVL
jgi:threonine/homoserine/homoserine lactone efflux protein